MARTSHWHKIWTAVSTCAPHFLHKEVSICSIMQSVFSEGYIQLEGFYNHCGLSYIVRQLPSLSSKASAWNQLLRLPVWVLVRQLQCHVLVKQPAHDIMLKVLVWDVQGFLWSSKTLSRTIPCVLISSFISTCTRIFGDTDECYRVVGGSITVVPLGMFWQPEDLSSLLEYHSKYWCISLIS